MIENMLIFIIASLAFLAEAQTENRTCLFELVNTTYNQDVLHDMQIINKSSEGAEKFFNYEMGAPNVLDFDLDPRIMNDIRQDFDQYVRDSVSLNDSRTSYTYGSGVQSFFVLKMPKWHSDIRWVSVDNLETYNHYLDYVRRLGLLDLFSRIIDFDDSVIVYSIFFVIRSKCNDHNFHVDFIKGGNTNAFTMMTPIDRPTVPLAFKTSDGKLREYLYAQNEGIAFGEGFWHSTGIGEDNAPQALFCVSIGTDKERDWDKISETTAYQSHHFMHPKKGFIKNDNEFK